MVSRTGLPLAVAGLVIAACGFGAPSAAAESGDIGVSVAMVDQTEIHVAVCIHAVDQLPARIDLAYSLSAGGTPVATSTWAYEDPDAAVLALRGCPAAFESHAFVDLTPGTSYSVSVTATMVPKATNAEGDGYIDDPARAVRTDSITVAATTLPAEEPPAGSNGAGAADGGSGGGSSPGGAGDGSSGGGSGGGSSPSATGGGETGPTDPEPIATVGVTPVVIDSPASFTAQQLRLLTPAQLSTIDPVDFGRFSARVFAALTAAQATAVTPEQASRIRPARAASLLPRAVAGLPPGALRSMRPAAVRALSPGAVGALTADQLRALTPRLVSSLRTEQLAALSAAQRALLGR